MSGFFIGRFQGSYESGAAGSYLVLNNNFKDKIYKYQVEMIANNSIDGILPLDIRQKDNTLAFYYNITSKQPLGELLKKRKLTGKEFVRVLSSITRVMLEAKNYLIYDRMFLLDENYMYVNPNTLDVSMVYIPVENEDHSALNFKEFIVRLIMFLINVDESANDILQKVLINVKEPAFNISDFYKVLMEAGGAGENAKSSGNRYQDEKADMESVAKQVLKPFIAQKQGPQKQKEERHREQEFKIPKQQMPEKNLIKKESGLDKQKADSLQYNNTTVIAMIVLQLAVAAALIYTLKSGVLDSLSEDTTTAYGAFALVLGAVDFLIIRRLLQSKNRTVVRKNDKKPEMPVKNLNISEKVQKLERKEEPLPGQQSKPEVKAVNMAQFKDATVLLTMEGKEVRQEDVVSKKQPYLVFEENGEKIYINRNSFILGRLKGRVDYLIKNNAVGKMHAELIERNEGYYIKDLNSRNGTFVNDVRIDSNVEYEINHKDRVVLANSQLTFYINRTK